MLVCAIVNLKSVLLIFCIVVTAGRACWAQRYAVLCRWWWKLHTFPSVWLSIHFTGQWL